MCVQTPDYQFLILVVFLYMGVHMAIIILHTSDTNLDNNKLEISTKGKGRIVFNRKKYTIYDDFMYLNIITLYREIYVDVKITLRDKTTFLASMDYMIYKDIDKAMNKSRFLK